MSLVMWVQLLKVALDHKAMGVPVNEVCYQLSPLVSLLDVS